MSDPYYTPLRITSPPPWSSAGAERHQTVKVQDYGTDCSEAAMTAMSRATLGCVLASAGLLLVLLFVAALWLSGQTPLPAPIVISFSVSAPPSPPVLPVLARVLHLMLVEGQDELLEFIGHLPSLTSDVVFDCWHTPCTQQGLQLYNRTVYASMWHSHRDQPTRQTPSGRVVPFDRKTDRLMQTTADDGMWAVQPSLTIVNEMLLNLSSRQSWTQGRNRMYRYVAEQEARQGWRWAYINLMDGDAHVSCPRVNASWRSLADPWMVQYSRWQALDPSMTAEGSCWAAFNAFLLTVGPAIGSPPYFGVRLEWEGSIAFFNDAIVSAFHYELRDFLLPMCERWDGVSWWVSQAYLVVQSVCFIGHALDWNYLSIRNGAHRPYPQAAPFAPFTPALIREVNLYPERLEYMYQLLKGDIYQMTFHLAPVISFESYAGFDRDKMIAPDCLTVIKDPATCVRTRIQPAKIDAQAVTASDRSR